MEKQKQQSQEGLSIDQKTELIVNGGFALTCFFLFCGLFGKDQLMQGLFGALYIGLSVGVAYWGLKFVYDVYLTIVQKKGNSEMSDAILEWMYAKRAGVSQNQNPNREDMEEFLQWKIAQEKAEREAMNG